ncbi:MAG: hypothetical protein K0U93_31080 [Gammaproteobacteria bacterium]|nr:hypothetical protein [Gammaproteobacteria bacterium]
MHWTPSRVEGLDGVSAAAIHTNRLELTVTNTTVVYHFADFARWPSPQVLWRALDVFGFRPHRPTVGERDWFHTPSDRFFRFYTRPEITVYCEAEHEDVDYRETLFFQINQTILAGGFDTFDLG